MKKRKTSIEVMRFLAAVMVAVTHIRKYIYPESGLAPMAYINVEFFFMITGFFAMRDASAEEKNGIEAHDAVLYAWKKAKSLFGLYIFAELLMFAVHTAEKGSFVLSEVLKELFHFKWEFLMIQMAGFNQAPAFNTDYLLSAAWFLSAMILALVPFYFLCRRFGKTFSGVIAPVSMVMIYAYIIQNHGTVNIGNQFVLGTMLGNYRAFAGLCAGAFVYYLNGVFAKMPDEKRETYLFQILDIVSWIMALSIFIFPEDLIPEPDFIFWLIPYAVIILDGFNDIGPISRLLNSYGCNLWSKLGGLSVYLYLLHVQIIHLFMHVTVTDHAIAGCLVILLTALVCSYLVMRMFEGIRSRRMNTVSE